MKKSIVPTIRLAMMAFFLTASLILGGCDMDGDEAIDEGIGIEEGVGEEGVDD